MRRSFREEFVLRAALQGGIHPGEAPRITMLAEKWAKVCCEAWGHDDRFGPSESAYKIEARCRRCGRIEERDVEDDR